MNNDLPKLRGTTAEDIAKRIKVEAEKLKAKPVEVPDAKKVIPLPPSTWELLTAWLKKYLTQQVATDKPVENPLRGLSLLAGLAKNWWKWLAILVVISGIIFAVWLTAK